jgi:hypothetical protein
MLFSMLIVLYFYINTLRSMCAMLSMVLFCSSFISYFPGVLLRYFLSDSEMFFTYTIRQQIHIYKYSQSHIVIFQRHVSVSAVTDVRVSFNKNTINIQCNFILIVNINYKCIFFVLLLQDTLMLLFVDPCIVVQFIKKNPTRCNIVSTFYYSMFIWSSTCFGRHTAHHQELRNCTSSLWFFIRGRLLDV